MRSRAGFSLVELLVAVAILGVLMAGLAQVLAGSLEGCNRVRDGLAAQRTLRWAARALDTDLHMAGFVFPAPGSRFRAPEPGGIACRLLPAQPILKVVRGAVRPLAAGDAPSPERLRCDVLGLVMDQLQPVEGTLAVPMAGRGEPGPVPWEPPPLSAQAVICLGQPCRLQAGDLLWVAGERFECARVLAPTAVRGGVPGAVTVGPGAFAWPHAAGARVGLVRPGRVVHLTVAYLPLPGAERLVPCLVRLEAPGPWDPAEPWSRALEGWTERSEAAVILAEQVTGFQVELATDAGWPDRGDGGEVLPSGDDPGRGGEPRLGVRQHPLLLQITLTAQAPGAPERRATLHLTVRPRNAGLALP